jgi:hypothetical protein
LLQGEFCNQNAGMAASKSVKKSGRKNKSDSITVRNYGLKLYIQGLQQNDIAERCGVSSQTITEWKQKYDWETKRVARTISLEELANKCMQKAGEMLDLDIKEFNSDAFAKAIAQLKTLLPKNTVDTDIMTFMSFQDFLLEVRYEDQLTDEFIKKVAAYQDRYVKKKLGYND